MIELFFSFWLGASWFSVDVYHYQDPENHNYPPETEIWLNYTWEI